MTLALAILGATLGVLNTALAIVQWRRSGPLVRVELKAGYLVPGGGVLVYDVTGFADQPLPQQGARPVVVVQVTNAGRASVDVSGVWIELGPGHLAPGTRVPADAVAALIKATGAPDLVVNHFDDFLISEHNEPLSYRLNGDSTKSWLVGAHQVEGVLDAYDEGVDRTMSARVDLGNGNMIRAKQRVQPSDLGIGDDEPGQK